MVNYLGIKDETKYYNVNLYSLSLSFTKAVNKYKRKLSGDADLKTKFLKLHRHYKFIVPIDVISQKLTDTITIPASSYLHDIDFIPHVDTSGSALYAST